MRALGLSDLWTLQACRLFLCAKAAGARRQVSTTSVHCLGFDIIVPICEHISHLQCEIFLVLNMQHDFNGDLYHLNVIFTIYG